MRNSFPLLALIFGVLVGAGAWLCDTLIQLTMPGDPCQPLFMWVTVAIFSAVFLTSMAYLGVLTIRMTESRWIRHFPNNGIAHVIGCATLFFTAMSPLIVLKGPKSSTTYGERVAVIEALEHLTVAENAVEKYFREQTHFPSALQDAGVKAKPDSISTTVESLVSTQDGAITLTFAAQRYPNLNGKTLVARPHMDGGQRSPGIAAVVTFPIIRAQCGAETKPPVACYHTGGRQSNDRNSAFAQRLFPPPPG
ncbi:MAG: hypothetical protein U1F34_00075 [Gammaproteobacteria bacterium]